MVEVAAKVRRLVDSAYSLRHTDGQGACDLAAQAVGAAEGLPYDSTTADLRALAWGHYGNALRIANELRESEVAMQAALECLGRGRCRRTRALILEFSGSLLADLRRFDQASASMMEALEIRRRLGDDAGMAKCLIHLANLAGGNGRPRLAVKLLTQALPRLRPYREEATTCVALHNLAWYLVDLGRPCAAQDIVLEQEHEGLVPRNPLLALRRRWLLARIAGALGDLEIAAAELADVRDDFLRRDQPYDAALACLELALAYADLGDPAKLAATLEGAVMIFAALGIDREAAAALLLESVVRQTELAKRVVPRVILALQQETIRPAVRGTV